MSLWPFEQNHAIILSMTKAQDDQNGGSLDALTILQALRTENAANREMLRAESEANRNALLGTLKIVSYPLAAVLAIAAFLGWRSFEDLKATIIKNAESATKIEIERIQAKVRDRVDQEFRSAEIQQTVRSAAKEFTQTAAAPIIRSTVESQVERSVSAVMAPVHRAAAETRAKVQALEERTRLRSLPADAAGKLSKLKARFSTSLVISSNGYDGEGTRFAQELGKALQEAGMTPMIGEHFGAPASSPLARPGVHIVHTAEPEPTEFAAELAKILNEMGIKTDAEYGMPIRNGGAPVSVLVGPKDQRQAPSDRQ